MGFDVKQFYEEVVSCQKCGLAATRNTVVFGEGSLHADVMLIGEGPGQKEDEQGRPFVGPAGQLLDEMLKEIGIQRKEVFIANVVKCRPPRNRDPKPEEQEACIGYLRRQVAMIRPKIIVCLGRIAAGVILKRTVYMTRENGIWTEKNGFWILPTFHPASLLHNNDYCMDARADFRKIAEKIKELGV